MGSASRTDIEEDMFTDEASFVVFLEADGVAKVVAVQESYKVK